MFRVRCTKQFAVVQKKQFENVVMRLFIARLSLSLWSQKLRGYILNRVSFELLIFLGREGKSQAGFCQLVDSVLFGWRFLYPVIDIRENGDIWWGVRASVFVSIFLFAPSSNPILGPIAGAHFGGGHNSWPLRKRTGKQLRVHHGQVVLAVASFTINRCRCRALHPSFPANRFLFVKNSTVML